ncbi:hypothetical protein [Marinoscillum pacificum]|uniref:hypothetical protein n=1 Tax=Marinoscillum pacificum TaxID=392723 RepID=UPI0021576FB7|nr:hypothetical protein [Marinoscillum pacificum]
MRLLFSLAILFLNFSALFAQTTFHGGYASTSIGMIYWDTDGGGFANTFEGAYLHNNTTFSASFLRSSDGFWGPEDKIRRTQLAIGKFHDASFIRLEGKVGPTLTYRRFLVGYDDDHNRIENSEMLPGIALDGSVGILIYSRASLGLNFHINYNKRRASYTPLLFLKIGVLSNRDQQELKK